MTERTPVVFITNLGAHDYGPAKEFGELRFLTKGKIKRYSTNTIYRDLIDGMQDDLREVRHSLDWANAEIERLGGDPNNIGPDKPEEKEPETDWSKVEPGTLVEVRDCNNGKWIPGLFQSVLDDLDADYPYRIYTTREEHGDEDAYCAYRQCRLYQPESGWIDWDGGGVSCARGEGGCLSAISPWH